MALEICGLTLRLTGARKEAKPTGARPVEPRVRPHFAVNDHTD
jgi:hypothetical protein